MSWLSVGTLAAAIVPEEILLAFNEVKLAPDPLKVVAVTFPANVVSPDESIAKQLRVFVESKILKLPSTFLISKSLLLFVSVK